MDSTDSIIVLFDGVCNLCNSAVQFIIHYNLDKNIKFASLQSNYVKNHYPELKEAMDSIIVIDGDALYEKSNATIVIARHLQGWPNKLKYIGFIPKFLRDFFYTLIAKSRYTVFGKRKECMVPTKALQSRFYT